MNKKKKPNIFDRLRSLKSNSSLTNTQNKIADYILNHPRKITLMNIEDLADKSDTSPSTIIRFTQKKLNISGYKDLKDLLKENISENSEVYSSNYKGSSIIGTISAYMYEEGVLTDVQESIVTYLINNVEEATTATVAEIAEKLDISGSTLIRFAQNKLNVDGFKELQEKLRKEVETTFNQIEFIDDFEEGEVPEEEMYKMFDKWNNKAHENRELGYSQNDFKLFKQNLNYNFENYYTKGSTISDFFFLIDNASNIVIYDHEDITRYVLHKNLNRYGYINYFTTSEIECLNQIDNVIENSKIKKKRTIKVLKNHTDPDLASYFSKNIEGNDNLLIVHSTFNHNESVNRILQKAQDNNLSIILVESNTTKEKIGDLNDINLRVNIGKTIAVNDDKDHRAIINDIMFYELLNSQIRSYIKEKKLSEKYNVEELFNEDGY